MATARTRRRPPDAGTLDEHAWIKAAQSVLADEGVDAVRVEPLAKSLGVTKGSFYWHFKDRNALLEAVLTDWRRQAVSGVIRRVELPSDTPIERLRRLIHYPVSGAPAPRGASLELAIRLWAKRDRKAFSAVEEVDEHRLTYIAGLMAAPNPPDERVQARAFLVYAYMLAEVFVLSPQAEGLSAACEDLLVDLEAGFDASSPTARLPRRRAAAGGRPKA